MNCPRIFRSRSSTAAPNSRRAISRALRERKVESRVRNPQFNLTLPHPAFSLPPLPGSHAAGLVPQAGRTLYPPRLTIGGIATAAGLEW